MTRLLKTTTEWNSMTRAEKTDYGFWSKDKVHRGVIMEEQNLEASFSTLVLSIASSAAMSLGLAPNPSSGEIEVDKKMAKFNIDLLEVLKAKTANNLTDDEDKFVQQLISDLKIKFIAL